MKRLWLSLVLFSGLGFAQSNITDINPPQLRDTDYVNKIINSFTAVDNHDHSSGKGLPVQRIGAGVVTNTALAASSVDTVNILANAVVTSRIADGAVTQVKRVALGQQLSSSSGSFTTLSTSFVDVTNLSVTITTTGRPVWVGLVPDASGGTNTCSVGASSSPSASGSVPAAFKILRGATDIGQYFLTSVSADPSAKTLAMPCGAINTVDVVAAGTYTYKFQALSGTGTPVFAVVAYSKLIAFEL